MIINKNVASKPAAELATKTNNAPEIKTEVVKAPDLKAEIPTIIPVKKEEVKTPDVKTASIEDRFYKMDMLISYREKWEKIKDSLEKVNKFKLTTDGRSDSITFKDGAGNSFTTFSPEVLGKVINWLKEDLSSKLQAVENEIKL